MARAVPGGRGQGRRAIVALTALLAAVATLVAIVSPANADEIGDKPAQIAQKLDDLQREQMGLEQSFNDANLKLDHANKDIAAAQVRVDQVSKEVDQHKSEVRLYAVQAYVHGSDGSSIDALITEEGDKAPQKAGYLEAATNNRQDAVDQLNASKHKLDDQIAQLDEAKGEAQAATDQASKAKSENDDAVAEQARVQSQVQGDLANLVSQAQARIADQQRQANEAQLAALATADANNPKPAVSAGPTTTNAGGGTTSTTARGTTTTGGGGPAPTTAPRPATPPPPPSPAPPAPPASGKAAAAASIAMGQMGVRYTYGGASPATGFDCSGLVMWAYAQVGISLPHPTTAQWAATQPISMSQLQVGDLVFFYGLGHVGIYVGGGTVVHAPHTGDVVRLEAIANMPVDGARRVVG